MKTIPHNKKTSPETNISLSEERPRGNLLLIEFSLLSLVAFVIIGYVVISTVRPALEGFTIREKESETVVFVNRNANSILLEEDFAAAPIMPQRRDRMERFIESLDIRGVLRIFITDSSGEVIYTEPEESLGTSFAGNSDVQFALSRRRATARFESLVPEEQEILGVKEAFIQAVPITFGASEDVAGVAYIVSRVGLLKKQVEETQQEMAIRISGGLLLLYVLLFVIVWRASRTIRNQSAELSSYAQTLELRVKERTRKLEETSKREIKQAKELARLKDEFVFVAAHELKAPITHLKWAVGEFSSDKDLQKKTPKPLKRTMQLVGHVSDALTRLVSDLLDVARLESGTIQISVHPTDLISIIEDIMLQFKPEAERKGIHVALTHDTEEKFPFVLGDSERLKEVFSNLISNAIKFNREDGRVEVSIVRKGDWLETRVQDTGIGMTKEELLKLFTKFWRAHPDIEGTGLGLWLAQQLIIRMNGELLVESKKGEGTTFTIRLPIAKERGVGSRTRTPL